MRRFIVLVGLCFHTFLIAPAFAGRPGTVVIRPGGVIAPAARAAMLTSGVKRSRIATAQTFSTDEMRVQVPRGIVGKSVHVTQDADHKSPASSLFRAFQSVEAAHAGHAAEVHVVLDAATRELYGEPFLSAMFGGLEASSLAFAAPDGVRHEVSLAEVPGTPSTMSKVAAANAPLAVWTGSSHPELGASLAKKLHVEEVQATRGSDGRLIASPVPAEARGKRVVLVQTKRMGDSERFHLDLIEMLYTAYQAKRAGAASVMVVSPYLPYSRSDRMDTPGTSVGAAILPQLMKRAGVDNVVFYSVHQAQEVGIFQALHIQVAHASGESLLAQRIGGYLKDNPNPNGKIRVIAPDAGAAKRARVFAGQLEKSLGLPPRTLQDEIVVADKERNGEKTVTKFKGDVKGATVVALDDETASGTSMKDVLEAAREQGAVTTLGAVSHLTGPAHKKLAGAAVDRLFVLDTLPQGELKASTGHPVEVIPIADHLAQVVKGLSTGKNVDKLLFFEH